ncbi:MAG: glycine cleavage system protein GcvH [Thermoanaerobacteraceae bacterium]|nr:glycine cleavage system protein GcvH [Thermoanaerobacteraceae bacterium]
MFPKDFKYSREHEWVKIEGTKVRLGITHYAQDALGDVVFVELPEVGTEFAANDSIGVIESVKAVSDVYTPVSGKVVAINEALLDSPELVNEDPYGDGWIVEMEMSDTGELDNLMTAEEYQKFLKEEA